MFLVSTLLITMAKGCPSQCRCRGNQVDCSGRQLTRVPKNLPTSVQELLLQRNNLTQISGRDFNYLTELTRLNLEYNHISVVHQRAFEKLSKLESLNLGHNKISCIQDKTFQNQKSLQILTLSDNNLTSINVEAFKLRMPMLRRLRLHSNRLTCDCHLIWLKSWLARPQNRGLANLATCYQPLDVRGQFLKDVPRAKFICNEITKSKKLSCKLHSCPSRCQCDAIGSVDCRDRSLKLLPQILPENSDELTFSYNDINVISDYSFADFSQLKLINLNYNGIRIIEPDAFEGLIQLRALHLQHNRLSAVDVRTFKQLRNLEVLFLQNNEIKCLAVGTFDSLKSLTTLSLYGNRIQSLPYGLFEPLRTLYNLYLASNPIQCDCKSKWLTRYLRKNQAIEKSDVRCHGPVSVQGWQVSKLKRRQYRTTCLKNNPESLVEISQCNELNQCPESCSCEGTKVRCSGLTYIPNELPISTSELDLRLNNIEAITNTGVFGKYASLKSIDLSNNQIKIIEDGAFEGAKNLEELKLNDNQLTEIRATMFSGLESLMVLQLRNNRVGCIGNHSFFEMRNLQHLDLFSNMISTIDQGSFKYLNSIQTLNILSNQLACDCRVKWLRNYIIHNPHISIGKPRCALPRIQRNLPLTDIDPSDFRCSGSEQSAESCTPKRKCPSNCVCEGTVVRCHSASYYEIPVNDIPDDVTELYMDGNKIKAIGQEINKFTKLEKLDLSDNKITRINSNAFTNLTLLSKLMIAYNKIQCVHMMAFKNLHSLETLSLQSNQISSIPEGAFEHLESLRRLDLGENPWYCDCNLRWMLQWMESHQVDPGISRCDGPKTMKNRLLTSNSPASFTCNGPLDLSVASKCNPCLSSPCKYDAVCRQDDAEVYSCECKPGFKGRDCDLPIDPCILKPCKNDARCHALNEKVFQCSCKPGFRGDLCELNVDDCESVSCPNEHMTCIDGINSYQCICDQGWEGENCDRQVVDFCLLYQPCANGGRCTNILRNSSKKYKCQCKSNFEGVNCTDEVEVCNGNKCQMDSLCVSDPLSVTGYRCICGSKYKGQFCDETKDTSRNILLQDDPCLNNECLNGAQCRRPSIEKNTGHECLCMPGFTGKQCENLFGLRFDVNGSYVNIPNRRISNEVLITLEISTLQENGILFYWGSDPIFESSRLVTVEFFSGHVKLKMGMLGSDWTTVYSPNPINDGKFHEVKITVSNKRISILIDDGRKITRENTEKLSSVSNEPNQVKIIQIGGVSSEIIEEGTKHWFFSNSTTFKGCLKSIKFDNEQYNFRSLSNLKGNYEDVTPGCSNYDSASQRYSCPLSCVQGYCVINDDNPVCNCNPGYKGKLCDVQQEKTSAPAQSCPLKCGLGSCIIPRRGRLRGIAKCQCPLTWSGENCQTRVRRCKGRKIRKFLYMKKPSLSQNTSNKLHLYTSFSNGEDSSSTISQRASKSFCKSVRPITNYECGDGKCHVKGSCAGCQPHQVKVRRVRYVCEDGVQFTSLVKKSKSCACKCEPTE